MFSYPLAVLAASLSWAGPAEPALEAADRQDYAAAFRLAGPCAEAGDAECMNVLAQLYQDGLGVKSAPALALKWRLASANKGFADAQFSLAVASKDPKQAKRWYKAAAASLLKLAQKNDTRAQVNLGAMYDEGRGVEKDDAQAAKWYAAAAVQGVQVAQINFAEMLADGRGVEADDVKAASWLILAVDEGETPRWREVYAKVSARLSRQQAEQAQGLAMQLKKVVRKRAP